MNLLKICIMPFVVVVCKWQVASLSTFLADRKKKLVLIEHVTLVALSVFCRLSLNTFRLISGKILDLKGSHRLGWKPISEAFQSRCCRVVFSITIRVPTPLC